MIVSYRCQTCGRPSWMGQFFAYCYWDELRMILFAEWLCEPCRRMLPPDLQEKRTIPA